MQRQDLKNMADINRYTDREIADAILGRDARITPQDGVRYPGA